MASSRPPSYVKRDKTPALGAPTTNDRKLDLFLQNIHERIESINNQNLADQITSLRAQVLDVASGTPSTSNSDAVTYRGTWDASAGTFPSLEPTQGDYYVVSVNGETSLSGYTGWGVGDWAVYNGATWDAVRNFTLEAGDNITLSKSAGNVITITGEETSRPGDAQAPQYIRDGDTYTVVEDRQVLYMLPITIDGTLVLDGSLVEVDTAARSNDLGIRTVATDTTLTPADWTVLVNAADGPIAITLPDASSSNKQTFNVKKIDSSANVVTIVGTVDGDINPTLASQYDSVSIQAYGSEYWLL